MSQHHEEAGKRWFEPFHRKSPLTCTAPRFQDLGPFFVDINPTRPELALGNLAFRPSNEQRQSDSTEQLRKTRPLANCDFASPSSPFCPSDWAFLLREILPSQNEIFRKARARIYSTTQNASFPTGESRKCLKNHLPSSSPFPHPFSQVAPPTPTTRPSNLLTA